MLVHMPEPPSLRGHRPDASTTRPGRRSTRSLGSWGSGSPAGRRSTVWRATGNPDAIRFPRAMADQGDFDFSLSGLKTAVIRHVNGASARPGASPTPPTWRRRSRRPSSTCRWRRPSPRPGTAGSRRSCSAAAWWRTRACASGWRGGRRGTGSSCMFPPMELCTDNGAMIACAGYLAARGANGRPSTWRPTPGWRSHDHVPGHRGGRVHRFAPVRPPARRGPSRRRRRRPVHRPDREPRRGPRLRQASSRSTTWTSGPTGFRTLFERHPRRS